MNFRAATNEKIRYIIAGIAIIFGSIFVWYMFSEPDIRDQRDAASSVRESLEHAGNEQQRVNDSIERIRVGIDDSIESAKRIEESNSAAEDAATRAKERIRRSEAITRDGERRISECREIIQSIRERTGQN